MWLVKILSLHVTLARDVTTWRYGYSQGNINILLESLRMKLSELMSNNGPHVFLLQWISRGSRRLDWNQRYVED